jgi:hypothetical protein
VPPDLKALMARYVQLGQLLPTATGDNIDAAVALEDPMRRAEARMILDEMGKVQAAIEACLAAARRSRT